jgi:hypothetical protein
MVLSIDTSSEEKQPRDETNQLTISAFSDLKRTQRADACTWFISDL